MLRLPTFEAYCFLTYTIMLREKLFLSIISLMLSMMTGLACSPLFLALMADPLKASQFGTNVLLILPVISLGLLWYAQPASVFVLRRFSFLAWAVVLMCVGIANLILVKAHTSSHSTMIMLGAVCVAISMHAHIKDKKQHLNSNHSNTSR